MRSLDIELPAGLHTGECELIGDDIGGLAVNIGARIQALAGADEVVVSSTVKDLVVGSGISFSDHGTREAHACFAREAAATQVSTGVSGRCPHSDQEP